MAVAAAEPGHQRASHADRERVIGVLQAAFAAGLLTKDELDLGVDRTLTSRTYADLAAATAGLRAHPAIARPRCRPAKPRTRPGHVAAWGACGLLLTAFLTIVIIPSGSTLGVMAVTAGVVYAIFCLLAGFMMLALRRAWPLPARHGPDNQVRFGTAGHSVRQRRPGRFVR